MKLLRPAHVLDRLIYADIGTLRDIRLLRSRLEHDQAAKVGQIRPSRPRSLRRAGAGPPTPGPHRMAPWRRARSRRRRR